MTSDRESDPAGEPARVFAPGYYVIARPHDDPARVQSGPHSREEAHRQRSAFTVDGWVMSTPALVYAVLEDGYNVAWNANAEKPSALAEN